MSNAHLNWAMRRNVSPSRKLVLLKLSDMANEKGVCWPSIANVARDCRLSARSVQRVLRELEVNGLIRVFARHRSDGSRTSNGYVVAPDGSVNLSPPGDAHDTTVRQHCHGDGDTDVTPLTHRRTPKESPLPPMDTPHTVAPGGGGDSSVLVFPPTLSAAEVATTKTLLQEIAFDTAQQVLDELAGNMKRNTIRGSPIAYLRGLVKRVHEGTFVPESGLVVLSSRDAQRRAEKDKTLAQEKMLDYPVDINNRNVRRVLDLKKRLDALK